MPWVTLLPCLVVCAAGAMLTYRRELSHYWWFPLLFAALSVIGGVMYGLGVRGSKDEAEAFVFSTAWDVTVTGVYLAVPLMVCGVRLTPAGWVGVAAVAVGLVLLKAFGTVKGTS